MSALPDRVEELTARWRLRVGEPFEPGVNCSWVAPATASDGRDVALKVAWAYAEALHEAEGLVALAGQGAVEVYASEHMASVQSGEGPDDGTGDTTGTLPLPIGVLGHEGGTVLIGLNGLRLLRNKAWQPVASGASRAYASETLAATANRFPYVSGKRHFRRTNLRGLVRLPPPIRTCDERLTAGNGGSEQAVKSRHVDLGSQSRRYP